MIRERAYSVLHTQQETSDITTLFLSPKDGMPFVCIPGQYITVYFKDTDIPQGKAYSISEILDTYTFSITVRRVGTFSHRLSKLIQGDVVYASEPYGFFYPEYEDSNLVLIAGGIGIAPLHAITKHSLVYTPKRKITVLYSAKRNSDLLFTKTLHTAPISTIYFLTQEHMHEEHQPSTHYRRVDQRDIRALPHYETYTEHLICGSVPFVRDMWHNLTNAGIQEDTIYTEAFFA